MAATSNWKTLKSGTSPEPLSTNSARGKGNDPPLRKKRESDFAKPGFVWTYKHYLTLIFHTLCRGGVLLSGVRTSENQITPGAHLYTPVHHQWTNSVLCAFGARGMSSIQYGTWLGDLKNKQPTHTGRSQGNLARTPDVAVVTPLNNFLGPAGDTVTAQKCSTKH